MPSNLRGLTPLKSMEYRLLGSSDRSHPPAEDVTNIVQQMGKSLGVEINKSNIDACYRLGKAKEGFTPPGIIVRFVQRNIKKELIRKRKIKTNFSIVNIGMSAAAPIFVNESLCPGRRRVFAAARAAKRDNGFKYLWIQNSNILARKEDGSAVLRLNSIADVQNMK